VWGVKLHRGFESLSLRHFKQLAYPVDRAILLDESRSDRLSDRNYLHHGNQDEAADLWERLPERRIDFEDAFPGMTLEDA